MSEKTDEGICGLNLKRPLKEDTANVYLIDWGKNEPKIEIIKKNKIYNSDSAEAIKEFFTK